MPMTFTFEPAATCFSSGISARQFVHQVAQKLSTTGPPLSEALLTSRPSSDLSVKSGIVLPTTTSSGLTVSAVAQPDRAAAARQIQRAANCFRMPLLLTLFNLPYHGRAARSPGDGRYWNTPPRADLVNTPAA